MKTRVIAVEHPLPGETIFEPITTELAQLIASDFYDYAEIHRMDIAGYGVKCPGGYVACIGMVKHPILGTLPAILHKTEPRRELQFLALPEMEPTDDDSPQGHENVLSFDDDTIVPNPR